MLRKWAYGKRLPYAGLEKWQSTRQNLLQMRQDWASSSELPSNFGMPPETNQSIAAPFSASQQSQLASLNPAIASLANRTDKKKFADMLARKIAAAMEKENPGKESNSGGKVANAVA